MNVLELSAVAIAIASGIIAATFVAGIFAMLAIRRRMNRTMAKVDEVAANVSGIVQDARRIESRAFQMADLFFDEIKPLVIAVSAMNTAARVGISSWARGANGKGRKKRSRARAAPRKGEPYGDHTRQPHGEYFRQQSGGRLE